MIWLVWRSQFHASAVAEDFEEQSVGGDRSDKVYTTVCRPTIRDPSNET